MGLWQVEHTALSYAVQPSCFFMIHVNFFDCGNFCCVHSLESEVFLEDWSGIFELTVLIRRIGYFVYMIMIGTVLKTVS